MAEILKKITTKDIGVPQSLAIEIAREGQPESVTCARVVGYVEDMESGQSQYGTWYKFRGHFKAQNLINGEFYESGALVMPEVADTYLRALLDTLGDNEGRVQVGFDVTAKYQRRNDEENIRWGCIPHITPSEDDALDKLMNSLPKPKNLPAPPPKGKTKTIEA